MLLETIGLLCPTFSLPRCQIRFSRMPNNYFVLGMMRSWIVNSSNIPREESTNEQGIRLLKMAFISTSHLRLQAKTTLPLGVTEFKTAKDSPIQSEFQRHQSSSSISGSSQLWPAFGCHVICAGQQAGSDRSLVYELRQVVKYVVVRGNEDRDRKKAVYSERNLGVGRGGGGGAKNKTRVGGEASYHVDRRIT